MAKYKVIALSVGGLNKIYDSGDIVDETAFPPGNAEILEKEGFLSRCESQDAPPPVDAANLEKALKAGLENESDDTGGDDDADEEDEGAPGMIGPIDSIGIRKIKKMLREKGVEFDPSASKETLYDLLVGKE